MNLRNAGKLLFLAVALSCSSCRTSRPPAMPVYIGDGWGGADGRKADGAEDYKRPTDLKGYWMTDPESFAKFAAWCYDTDIKTVKKGMGAQTKDIHR